MTIKYIFASYSIVGGLIYASNTTTYNPNDMALNTWWNLLKFDTSEGTTTASVSFVLSPLILPVYLITLPFIYSVTPKD